MNLPPHKALHVCFDDNLAVTWKLWKNAWKHYEIATGVQLPGKYQIVINGNIPHYVHDPRRVTVALQQPIKEKLDKLVERKVLMPVTEPTQWVSSMLAIVKPNKAWICIDSSVPPLTKSHPD